MEGSEPGKDGREMDDNDMVIEPAGSWRMSIIVGDVDGRATQRGRRLLVVVVNENTNQKPQFYYCLSANTDGTCSPTDVHPRTTGSAISTMNHAVNPHYPRCKLALGHT